MVSPNKKTHQKPQLRGFGRIESVHDNKHIRLGMWVKDMIFSFSIGRAEKRSQKRWRSTVGPVSVFRRFVSKLWALLVSFRKIELGRKCPQQVLCGTRSAKYFRLPGLKSIQHLPSTSPDRAQLGKSRGDFRPSPISLKELKRACNLGAQVRNSPARPTIGDFRFCEHFLALPVRNLKIMSFAHITSRMSLFSWPDSILKKVGHGKVKRVWSFWGNHTNTRCHQSLTGINVDSVGVSQVQFYKTEW